MHKGYAFVQFSNPVEAKNAVDGEDGRLVLNQNIGKFNYFFAFPAHRARRRSQVTVAGQGGLEGTWIKGQEIM